MLTAGEEPLFLLRRLVRAAVEDVGLADPNALTQCIAAKDAYDFLGSPEGELAIAQACLYLAVAGFAWQAVVILGSPAAALDRQPEMVGEASA